MIKINKARPALSKMLNSFEHGHKTAYVIGSHNTPKGVLIDIHTAKKYIPKHYFKHESTLETDGERFKRMAIEWLKGSINSKINDTKNLTTTNKNTSIYGESDDQTHIHIH